MENKIKEQIARDCTIIATSTLLGAILDDPRTGGAGGALLVLGIHTLPAIIQNKPQNRRFQPRTAFNYAADTNRRGWLIRPLSEFFGTAEVKQPARARPLFLEQRLYGSCTRDNRPYIITDDALYKVFNAINRVGNPDRNLSYRELVGNRRVARPLYEAFWNLLRFTEWYTGFQMIVQTRHQWYSLGQPAATVRALLVYIEHEQRGRGAGAPSMRPLPPGLQ